MIFDLFVGSYPLEAVLVQHMVKIIAQKVLILNNITFDKRYCGMIEKCFEMRTDFLPTTVVANGENAKLLQQSKSSKNAIDASFDDLNYEFVQWITT